MRISLGSKVLFVLCLIITFISVASTYYKYMVIEDYEVFYQLNDEGQIINTDE